MTPMITHVNENPLLRGIVRSQPISQLARQQPASQPPASQLSASQRASEPAASQPTSQPDFAYAMSNSKSPKHYHDITIRSSSRIDGAVIIHICGLYCILFNYRIRPAINLSFLVSRIKSWIKSQFGISLSVWVSAVSSCSVDKPWDYCSVKCHNQKTTYNRCWAFKYTIFA